MFRLYDDYYGLRFDTMEDEDIVELANANNSQALEFIIYKYKNFVRSKVRTYFIVGADKDDIIQEGMIGLYKAIKDYDRGRLASFRSFAEICITRQIITAIKTATRMKHMPLNFYISLNKPVYEESERTLEDVIPEEKNIDPMELFIGREDLDIIESKIGEVLSPLELEVLMSYLEGRTYQEISGTIHRDVKCIDNALQRVKRKLEMFLNKN